MLGLIVSKDERPGLADGLDERREQNRRERMTPGFST